MKEALYLFSILIILASCSTNNLNQENQSQDIIKVVDSVQTDEIIPELTGWADYHIRQYLAYNKLSKVGTNPISYKKDTLTRNERNYASVNIGYQANDKFESVQSIFIDQETLDIYEYKVQQDSLILWSKFSTLPNDKNEIPPNGTYSFDAAFAEWEGKSMGVQLTVVIHEDSVLVIYEGRGSLTAEIGEVLDKGKIMKHKSGEWIIGTQESDKNLDEIAGCTGGPAIIDFKNKKYWMC